jgi:pyrimidine-nucleoside phosphorylase
MYAVDIIAKKRDGGELSRDEIRVFVRGVVDGTIPDYQIAAWLMAVFLRGMSRREIADLTLEMAFSGEVLDLSDIVDYAVDKHSSGGVGDKTSLVVLPLVASCGVTLAKMSGRGLGFSGGTIDKLESIRGFRVNLSASEFRELARAHHLVLAGQSATLAPADGRLYALRDVTATVPSLPLIASSIMSKKIAAGANGIVLDVKLGEGAFMPTVEAASELARMMVDIGRDAGREVTAILSDMNQPLGEAIGNAIEVEEAIRTLQGKGPVDFTEHCLLISGEMLRLAGQGNRWMDPAETRTLLERQLRNGSAHEKLRQMVSAQGGDVRQIDDPALLPQSRLTEVVTGTTAGVVARVSALKLARAAFVLGGGRATKADPIDHAVGVRVHVRQGDAVQAGQPFATVYANDEGKLREAVAIIREAITWSPESVEPLPFFYGVIRSSEPA